MRFHPAPFQAMWPSSSANTLVLLQSAVERLTDQVCKTLRLPDLETTSLQDMIQWAGEQLQQMQDTVSVSA